jgi:hypothetical protein
MARFVLPLIAVLFGCGLAAGARAQAVQDRFPGADEMKPGPPPVSEQPPANAAKPARPAKTTAKPAAAPGDPARPARAATAVPAGQTVACNGSFAKDSSHEKLATAFGAKNVAWDDVDGPGGARLKASVLFPNDPRRRLEVVWTKPETRTDMRVIAINGQSTWTAPKGLKLGMTLAAVEKLNGKPFRLTGFDKDTGGTVQSWDAGALAELPGGCKVALRFEPDPKISPEVRKDVAVSREFESDDTAMKKAVPKVVEILIGY